MSVGGDIDFQKYCTCSTATTVQTTYVNTSNLPSSLNSESSGWKSTKKHPASHINSHIVDHTPFPTHYSDQSLAPPERAPLPPCLVQNARNVRRVAEKVRSLKQKARLQLPPIHQYSCNASKTLVCGKEIPFALHNMIDYKHWLTDLARGG